MPISSDNAKLSIDFSYEWVATDGQTFEYQMKFLHGPMGPIIQIANGHEVLEFPAQMFVETAEFLVSQGVLKGNLPSAKKSFSSSLGIPIISKKPTAVQVKKETGTKVAAFQSFDSPNEDDEEDGVEMQQPPEKLPKRVKDDRPAVTGNEGVTEEEARQIARERLAARAKEKAHEKRIKKRDE